MTGFNAPNFGVPVAVPSGIPSALLPYIKPLYIALYNIVQNLIRYAGIGPRNASEVLLSNGDPTAILTNNINRFYIQASETITEGALVSFHSPLPGVLGVRNANATDYTKPCHAFCSQPGGIAAGAIGEVIVNAGVISNLVGLTVASEYFLATANGQMTTVAPVAAGNLEQSIGVAITTTALRFWTGRQAFH